MRTESWKMRRDLRKMRTDPRRMWTESRIMRRNLRKMRRESGNSVMWSHRRGRCPRNEDGSRENVDGVPENAEGLWENAEGVPENVEGPSENADGIRSNAEKCPVIWSGVGSDTPRTTPALPPRPRFLPGSASASTMCNAAESISRLIERGCRARRESLSTPGALLYPFPGIPLDCRRTPSRSECITAGKTENLNAAQNSSRQPPSSTQAEFSRDAFSPSRRFAFV